MEFTVYDLTSASASSASAWRAADNATSHAAAYRHTFEQAALADEGGLDTYFVTEHHFNGGFQVVPSPHLLVAALSQTTTRIRLGAMCTNLPLYHPVRLAEEIRMMDLLSQGRLELGIGRGTAPHEQAGFGVAREETEALFEQSFELIRQLLVDGGVDKYDTGPWQGTGVSLTPDATQSPCPPLWMTANSEKSVRKAARLGLNLCTGFLDVEDTARTSKIYREEWQAVHPDEPVGKYGTLQHIFVAETESEARRLAQPHLQDWLGAGRDAVVANKQSTAVDVGYEEHRQYFEKITRLSFDDAVERGRIIFGTPDQCAAQLLRKAEGGVQMFQGWFQFGGLDPEASNRSLQLFGEQVAPVVRAAGL
ncbi:LLM class flavin-dependent oxidoreductase [Amycolatopsis sp. NPDC051071]|uniref:LLM class flavin-dependent oxidoreductase n=1 Tax=Amycolatopsis sp. NPDC051071 TaxID=3154637 RepID=UPI00343827EA